MGDGIRGGNVTIDGTGKYDEVDCESFTVNGTGKVDGDLYAADASVNGTAKVGGRVDAGHLNVDGTVKVDGDVSADDFTADGTAKIGGNLDGHDVEGDGTTKVEGSVVAASARFDGTAKVRGLTDVTDLDVDGTGKFGDVNADTFTASGTLKARDVAAREFDLSLHGDSVAASVRGTDVRVRRGDSGSLGRKLLNRGDPVFEVDTVEAETVELDATEADVVAGERVTLGPDVVVETVYADDLDAAEASIGEVHAYDDY